MDISPKETMKQVGNTVFPGITDTYHNSKYVSYLTVNIIMLHRYFHLKNIKHVKLLLFEKKIYIGTYSVSSLVVQIFCQNF